MNRGIVAFNRVTADGYFAGPDGSLEWVVPEPEVDARGAESVPSFDTILFGRRTYEMFERFWPRAVDDAGSARPPHAPGRTAAFDTMATWVDAATKVVFSRTRERLTWRNSRLVRDFDAQAIEAMKQERGKDIIIFGSGSIVSQLARHGLIDEYQFVVSPSLLGSGQPLIGGAPAPTSLSLLEATAYQSGNVLLRYAARPGPRLTDR
ncbi:MAG TPA: dihydrofolate reductase family protein [Gemmatimonadaceae bacterium]|nr:dihydrofolate reductase family protein [Gemmatimonadaceae bacterium]